MTHVIIAGAAGDEEYMAKLLGIYNIDKIHAFEPFPDSFAKLQKNCRGETRIQLVEAACWINDNKVRLYLGASPLSHSLCPEKNNVDENNYITVQGVNLSEYIRECGQIFHIKMNIEGAEYDVLDHLFSTGMINNVHSLTVQFHNTKLVGFTKLRHNILSAKLEQWQKEGHLWDKL